MTDDPYEVLRDAARFVDPGYSRSKQMIEDFNNVFQSTPAGKRVFYQIMDWAGFHKATYVKGDPYDTHVKLGERNIGARIWATTVTQVTDKPQTTNRKANNGDRT